MKISLADFDKAIAAEDFGLAEKLLKEMPVEEPDRLALEGTILLRKAQYREAEHVLQKSLAIKPNGLLAVANLVTFYIKINDHKKAKIFGELAYKANPKNLVISINYSAALLHEQEFERVLEVLGPHKEQPKHQEQIFSALISANRALFRIGEAETLLQEALEKFPESAELARIRADIYAEYDPVAAKKAFDLAEKADPKSPATRWNRSLVDLRTGDFKKGWVNYDAGLDPAIGKIGRPMSKVFHGVTVVTDRSQLDPAKWTAVVAEQGIGDQVLFLGCFAEFVIEFPKTILVCEKRMHALLGRSFPSVKLMEYGVGQLSLHWTKTLNGIFPIGSLQKHFRSKKSDYTKNRKPYLKADADKVHSFREKILRAGQFKKLIGFSWKGGFWERAQQTKTLEIENWDPIFRENADVMFVCLQYGDVSREKKYLSERFKNVRFIDGLDFKKDLDGWTALACACDHIVSVSTALVHFAGACGKPITLLLSDKGSPFIWGIDDDKAICYPKVSILRKPPQDSMPKFFDYVSGRVADAIEAL